MEERLMVFQPRDVTPALYFVLPSVKYAQHPQIESRLCITITRQQWVMLLPEDAKHN